MKAHSRIYRDPEKMKVNRGIVTTDDEYETIKMAARELKMPIGQAVAFLAQAYLDELAVE